MHVLNTVSFKILILRQFASEKKKMLCEDLYVLFILRQRQIFLTVCRHLSYFFQALFSSRIESEENEIERTRNIKAIGKFLQSNKKIKLPLSISNLLGRGQFFFFFFFFGSLKSHLNLIEKIMQNA